MNIEFVRQLMSALQESGFGELEWSDGECRIRLAKSGQPATLRTEAHAVVAVPPSAPQASPGAAPPVSAALPAQAKQIIRASMTGSFYARPSPDEPPFVTVGKRVEEGDTLGILEAMKMLNPIESEFTGKIVEIKVSDGDSVSVGDEIFVLEQEAGATDV